ncbi:hypothetical protein KDH83_12800 [Achromobacter sp. Marseille-Q0513]|uniref:hypothetical protein n=1 Tax=Achromobacter sp. Marseille-Q0513 TaxID=2829161 RepID=UPI001BA2A09F|nr:hypothetical protein [Achromobacter sp. Marseille-Q0513]MBR8654172.1 hypothetical protein [Achromobacter sp. Marseille-Q0513]
MRSRALAINGDRAIVIETDEDGETEEMLAPLWQDVSDALLYAAMALGARNTWTPVTRRRSCAPGAPATSGGRRLVRACGDRRHVQRA